MSALSEWPTPMVVAYSLLIVVMLGWPLVNYWRHRTGRALRPEQSATRARPARTGTRPGERWAIDVDVEQSLRLNQPLVDHGTSTTAQTVPPYQPQVSAEVGQQPLVPMPAMDRPPAMTEQQPLSGLTLLVGPDAAGRLRSLADAYLAPVIGSVLPIVLILLWSS